MNKFMAVLGFISPAHLKCMIQSIMGHTSFDLIQRTQSTRTEFDATTTLESVTNIIIVKPKNPSIYYRTLSAARNEPLFSEILLSFWKKLIYNARNSH